MQIVSKEAICMKCQSLFSGEKYKKNIVYWLSAELAKREEKVNQHNFPERFW